jgi:hypothetical protein
VDVTRRTVVKAIAGWMKVPPWSRCSHLLAFVPRRLIPPCLRANKDHFLREIISCYPCNYLCLRETGMSRRTTGLWHGHCFNCHVQANYNPVPLTQHPWRTQIINRMTHSRRRQLNPRCCLPGSNSSFVFRMVAASVVAGSTSEA